MIEYANFIGIIGVVIILLCYGFSNIGYYKTTDKLYLFLNLVGSILILFSLFYHWNLPSVIIEIAWIVLTIVGFLRLQYTKKII